METDLRAKVRANDQASLGESRFVILPKLHWLCPVVALEDKASGQVVVDGDNRLDIPELEALTLEELVAFVRDHFQKDAPSVETNKTGGVAMPLLVAEIVRCPKDVAFIVEDGRQHWYELSRGFILDPKCWDPSPLCHEPVRFRRTLRRNVSSGNGEREYEVHRTDCADEGFIKPDVDEAAALQQKQHKFADLANIGPCELCQEFVSLLSPQDVLFTHADLKRSTRELLSRRQPCTVRTNKMGGASPHRGVESAYLRSCLESVILGANGDDESKHARRVGYLLLDVFDGLNHEFSSDDAGTSSSSLQEYSDWVALLAGVARDSERWEFLNLVLRAIDLTLSTDHKLQWGGSETSRRLGFLDKLLASRSPRWNAVVVEVSCEFQIGVPMPGHKRLKPTEEAQKVQSIFAEFVDQHDWQSAERLATLVQEHDMVQTLFKHLSLLNMTKALRRLQKIAVRTQNTTMKFSLASTAHSADTLGVDGIPPQVLGHPIDHERNRALNKGSGLELKWKYIDSIEEIKKVVRHLEKCESSIHAEDTCDEQAVVRNMLVGLDCEWRPQFLMKDQAATSNVASERAEQCEKSRNQFDENQAGLSIFQLAVGQLVYMIDVQGLGAAAAAPLSFIWRPASRLMLIGFCVQRHSKDKEFVPRTGRTLWQKE